MPSSEILTPVSTVGKTTTPTTSSSTSASKMDKDTFLKLLVAQLKYQDPSQPADTSEFISQTATFTQVETMQAISEQNAKLLSTSQLSTAGSLVGRVVSYHDASGATVEGTVDSVKVTTDGLSLVVGKDTVALSDVMSVASAPAARTAPSTTPPSTTPAATTPPSTTPAATTGGSTTGSSSTSSTSQTTAG